MRRSRKNSERIEQVRKGTKKPAKIEPLRPQAKGEMIREPIARIKERFGDILQNLSDLIWEVDENCVFTWCSGAAKDIFGVAAEKLVGRRPFDLMPAEEAQRIKNIIEEIFLKKETIKDLEAYHEDKQGRRHWLCVNGIPILDNKGTLKGYIGVCKDIISQKKTEEALRESENKFKTLANEAFDSIVIHDGQRIIEVNKAFGRLWGYDPKEAAGMKIDKFFAPECWEDAKKKIQSGYDRPYEADTIRKDGTRFQVEIAGHSITYKGKPARIATTRDITERKRAEMALRTSEEQHRTILQTTMDGFWLSDMQGRFLEVNDAYCQMSGYSREELLKMSIAQLEAAETPEEVAQHIQKIVAQGTDRFETLHHHKDRSVFHVEVSVHFLPTEAGRLFCFFRDITERKKAEERLQEERNLLRTLIDHIPDNVYVKDKDSRFVVCNKTMVEYWETEGKGNLIGKTDFDLFEPDKAQVFFDEEQKLMQTGKLLTNLDRQITDKTGNVHYGLTTKVPLKDSRGDVTGIIGINRDITERKKTEQKLLEYQKKLKSLAARLTLAEERERRRIAGELHDNVSQSLALAKIKLDALRASITYQPLVEALKETCDSLEKAIQDTRSLTFDLSYPILYELGFEAAVAEWLSEQVQDKHDIATEFQDDGLDKPLDDDVRVILFRNVRELLINCIKHANAGKVRVDVRRIDDSIEVIVEDNGVGFDTAEVRSLSGKRAEFGLFSVHESIEELGGHFEIESKPGAGCKATMTAPLKGQSRKKED